MMPKNWPRTCSILSFSVFHFTFLKAVCRQGIIDMNRNGNLANLFSYVCNGKKSKELFASTLNGIPILVLDVCLL